MDAAVLIEAIEPASLDIAEGLLERFLRRRRQFFLGDAAGAAGSLELGDSKRVHDVKAAAGSEREDARGNFVGAVAADFGAALDTKGLAATREEQAEIVVYFGGGGDGRARVTGGVFLANGHGRSDAGDFVDIGLFHALEELARIGGERFHVAPLALCVHSVKGEGRLTGTADAGDDGDGVVGDFDGDVAKVVNAGAEDADGLLFAEHGCEFFSGQR